MSLQQKTLRSIASSSLIQIVSQVFNFGISILIARVLSPEEFGLIALGLVFVALAQTLSDLGLSSSLIQKKFVADDEAYSCLCINLSIGFFMAVLLFVFSGVLAKFYETPSLQIILISLSPLFIINSLASVPRAILSRKMNHGHIALSSLIATLLGSLAALVLVYLNFGVWALVAQQLIIGVFTSLLLCIKSRIVLAKFDLKLVKPLLPFSFNVFCTRILQEVANQGDKVIIGKFMGTSQLGFYTKADQLARFPLRNISGVISTVMFPALSKIKNDVKKVKGVYLRTLGLISTLTFPLFSGLAYLSSDIILLLLGEKWLPLVPYFVFFCVASLFLSLGQISGAFFLSQGKAKQQFKLISTTQVVKVILLIIGAQFGVIGIIVSLSFATVFGFSLTVIVLARILDFGLYDFFSSIYKSMLTTLLMVLVLFLIGDIDTVYRMTCLPLIGAALYVCLNILIKNSFLLDAWALMSQTLRK